MRQLTPNLQSELPLFKVWGNTASGVICKVNQVPPALCLTCTSVSLVIKTVGEECLCPFSLLWLLYKTYRIKPEIFSSKLKRVLSQRTSRHAKMTGDQCGWTRNFWPNSKHKKEVYRGWKEGWVMWEEKINIF